MTATQSLKIYEILHRHFHNEADATKAVVQEIETISDNKFDKEKNQLSTKDDISRVEKLILQNQTEIEKRFNTQLITIVSTVIAVGGLIIAIVKL